MSQRCRCWRCELCEPDNRRKLADRARAGEPDKFITLTASTRRGQSPDHRARMMVKAFREACAVIVKRFAIGRVQFIAVFEATKAGEPHLHILARLPSVPCEMLERLLSDHMRRATGSPRVKVERIDSVRRRAAYLAKAPALFRHCRRFWTSRDWLIERAAERLASGWQWFGVPFSLDALEVLSRAAGVPHRRNGHYLDWCPP